MIMKRGTRRSITFLIFCLLIACCPVRNMQKEQLFIAKFESKIDQLVAENHISPDKGQARKDALQKDMQKYRKGEVDCKEVRKKEKYLAN